MNDSPHSQVGDTTAEKERAAMRNSTAQFKSCFFSPFCSPLCARLFSRSSEREDELEVSSFSFFSACPPERESAAGVFREIRARGQSVAKVEFSDLNKKF